MRGEASTAFYYRFSALVGAGEQVPEVGGFYDAKCQEVFLS